MAERRQRVEELFHAALQQSPKERSSFLSDACASDLDLKAEVESLISAYERPGNFLVESTSGRAPTSITKVQSDSLGDRRNRSSFRHLIYLATIIVTAVFAYGAF